MRILYVDHTAKLGGAEIALRNLLDHLDSSLVDPIVLLFADGPLATQLKTRFQVHVFPLDPEITETRKDSLGWKSLAQVGTVWSVAKYTFRLSRMIRRLNVDAVHTNSLKSHLIGGFAARLARRPLIWHLRDRIAGDYLPIPVVRAIRHCSRFIPDVVIANSKATLGTIPLSESRLPGTQFVVHDGCNVALDETTPLTSTEFLVGIIGRISPWKGQDIFLRAAAIVHRQYPAVRFQIIGAPLFNEAEYEATLKTLRDELGLATAVEFLGFVEDIPSKLRELNLVVHASTVGEPFGQVIIEAMAASKPVIATNGGGVPEIVRDGVTGYLVPMGDEQALAAAIGQVLEDPTRSLEMGHRGYERARDFFSLSRCARAVENVYAATLKVER